MDDDKKKLVKIIAIVACLILAIGITVITNTGGGSGGSAAKGDITLMCTDEDCGAITEVSRDEYREMMRAGMEGEGGPGMMMMPGMGPMTVECPECSEKTAMAATVCEECGEVFIMDPMSMQDDGYPDECPECGFSKMEARRNKK